MFSGRPSGRPAVVRISMELTTDIHHVSAAALLKRFSKSDVKDQDHF